MILALHDLNTAVEGRDLTAMLRALQYPGLKVVEYVSSTDAELYFKHLRVCINYITFLTNTLLLASSQSSGILYGIV